MQATFNEKLCDLVREYQWLYDATHPDYKSRDMARVSWAEIATELNSDSQTVLKRWRYIRDRYTRKLKDYVQSRRSGAGADLTDAPRLVQDLGWLKTFISHRDTSTNFPGDDMVSKTKIYVFFCYLVGYTVV